MRSTRIATRSRAARRRGWSRSTTRSCDRGTREEASGSCSATGLLKEITPELDGAPAIRCGARSRALDRYRARFAGGARVADQRDPRRHAAPAARPGRRAGASPPMRSSGASSSACCRSPRRDIERLQQILAMQPRLIDMQAPAARAARPAAPRRLRRSASPGSRSTATAPTSLAHWRALQAEPAVTAEAQASRRQPRR